MNCFNSKHECASKKVKYSTSKKTVEDIRDKFKQKPKSTFTPNEGREASLDLYIELVKNDIVTNLKKCGMLNLSKDENDAFYQLLYSDSIFIRPADKGSGIVVMGKDNYMQSLQQEMEKNNSYERQNLI